MYRRSLFIGNLGVSTLSKFGGVTALNRCAGSIKQGGGAFADAERAKEDQFVRDHEQRMAEAKEEAKKMVVEETERRHEALKTELETEIQKEVNKAVEAEDRSSVELAHFNTYKADTKAQIDALESKVRDMQVIIDTLYSPEKKKFM